MSNKILVTLGPSSLNESFIRHCADKEVYLLRINLSHTPIDMVLPTIEKIRNWTDTPICLDSEGAQLRNQYMAGGRARFDEGETVKIHFDPVEGDSANISFSPRGIARQFAVGDVVRVDFDHVEFRVNAINEDHCLAEVIKGGVVGSNKAADVDRELDFEPLTEKDMRAIEIGLENGVRNFALSFTNSGQDVELMRSLCGDDAHIICKVESRPGVLNLSDILARANGVLIDRGDLSRQVPIEKIPVLQRRIIAEARAAATDVFVATNLLESMVETRAPNRAEVNDVVSTVLMGASGLVLAAETAIGRYPHEAVTMIHNLMAVATSWHPDASIEQLLDL